MTSQFTQTTLAILFSGGLDSSALLAHLLDQERVVQPIYVAGGLVWQDVELSWARRLLAALPADRLRPLVVLDLPLGDLYGDHWSITGQGTPDGRTRDDAVYLPGRNPLLLVKARLWCQLHGIEELAIGSLASNPFSDATDEFFAEFETALDRALSGKVRLTRPLARSSKSEALSLGGVYPLHLTFSCLAPRAGEHCGRCNKCAERGAAFAARGVADPTRYACEPAAEDGSDGLASRQRSTPPNELSTAATRAL